MSVVSKALFRSFGILLSLGFIGVLILAITLHFITNPFIFFPLLYVYIIILQFVINELSKKEIIINELPENTIQINLSCAYCNILSDVYVDLDEDSTFTCPHCKQLNKIFIQFTTSRITTPLIKKVDAENLDLDEPNKERK